MTQHPLHIGQRHVRIPGHPIRSGMAKIMQGPVRTQPGARPGKLPMRRVIGQRPERTPPRPPQRLIPTGRHQAVDLGLVEPQPHERVRRRRQLLQRPGALPHHCDQLPAGVRVGSRGAQQLRRPRAGRDPKSHQRPIPMTRQPSEQPVEHLLRDVRCPRCTRRGRNNPERWFLGGSIGLRCAPGRPPSRPRSSGNGFTIGPSRPAEGTRRSRAARSRCVPSSPPHISTLAATSPSSRSASSAP